MLTSYGLLNVLYINAKEQIELLHNDYDKGVDRRILRQRFNELKERNLSYNTAKSFNKALLIQHEREAFWNEWTKERKLLDGSSTTMQQEVFACVNEIKEAISQNEATEIHPNTFHETCKQNDIMNEYYNQLQGYQKKYWESPYGNDQYILKLLEKFHTYMKNFEEARDNNGIEWPELKNSYHIGLNVWNGHPSLKLKTYSWIENNHSDFYKKPRKRCFLKEILDIYHSLEKLYDPRFDEALADMRESEWYAFVDTLVRRDELFGNDQSYHRSESLRTYANYAKNTFDIQSIDGITISLDQLLPIYAQKPNLFAEPVVLYLFDALKKQLYSRAKLEELDKEFWGSILGETMSIKEALNFMTLPMREKTSKTQQSSPEDIKRQAIYECILPKIEKIKEHIYQGDWEPILSIYGIERVHIIAPA